LTSKIDAIYYICLNFTLKYVSGSKMEKTYKLSKRLDWKVGIENNNEKKKLIKKKWKYRLVKVVVERLEIDIVEKIKKTKGKNEEVIRVVEKIKKTGIKMWREDE